jgi:hypothetical protein
VARDAVAEPAAQDAAAVVLRVGAAAVRAVRRAVPGVRVALPSAVAWLPCRVLVLPAPLPAVRFGHAMQCLQIASP